MRDRWSLFLLCFGAACSDTRTVHGVVNLIHVTPDGDMTEGEDIAGQKVTAPYKKDDGSLEKISGHGNSDGTFEILGVPNGKYYLNVSYEAFYTDAEETTIEHVTRGRGPFGPGAAPAGTELELFAANMRP